MNNLPSLDRMKIDFLMNSPMNGTQETQNRSLQEEINQSISNIHVAQQIINNANSFYQSQTNLIQYGVPPFEAQRLQQLCYQMPPIRINTQSNPSEAQFLQQLFYQILPIRIDN